MSKKSTDDISKIIKDGIDQILEERGDNYTQASSVSKGRAFTEWYIKDIACYLDDNIIDEEIISDGLGCDGSNDMGIDFIYQKDTNDFWICQSKYVGKKSSLKKDTIAGFFEIHRRIFDAEARSNANRSVRELLPDIGSNPSIKFVLLTNGKTSEDNQREFDRMCREAGKDENADNYEWELVNWSKIKSNYNDVLSSAFDKYPTVKIPIPNGKERYIDLSKQVSAEGKYYSTIVTVISGNMLRDLCKQHKSGLFNLNIRGFLGNKGKNKKIRETLDNEPGLFYLYNNGISAICTEMNISDSSKHVEVECKDFSIINGAQTACCIRDFDDTEKLKKVMVLIRITQAEKIKSEKGLNRKIVEYNNTQNVIRDADFRSNDKVQKILQKLFEDGKYQYKVGKPPYKILDYMRKRGIPKKGKIPVSVENMAKSLYAFNIAFGNRHPYKKPAQEMSPVVRVLFRDESEKGHYQELFEREIGEIHSENAEKFAAIAMLNIYLNERLKKDTKEHDEDEVDGMVYRSGRHFLRSFGYIVRNFYSPEEQKIIYKRIVNGSAFENGNFVPTLYIEVTREIHRTISQELRRAEDESSQDESNIKGFNFKAWVRGSKKSKSLIDALNYIEEYGMLPKI